MRVREIRAQLEAFSARLAGVTFDIVSDEMPCSLDYGNNTTVKYVHYLAERLNPLLKLYHERISEGRDNGDDVGSLRWEMADAAFAIGVLAGAIFTGSPERDVDRLEKGLVHATASRRWICKPPASRPDS